MSIAKKLKQLVKGSFGSDPNDPWSPKAGLSEGGGLSSYLLARGINPKFISKDTKIAHAKSNEYKKWQKDHKFEEVEYVEESASLDAYLKTKGVNPAYLTKDQKIAYSKSMSFVKWKNQHMKEDLTLHHSPNQIGRAHV